MPGAAVQVIGTEQAVELEVQMAEVELIAAQRVLVTGTELTVAQEVQMAEMELWSLAECLAAKKLWRFLFSS